MKWKIKEECPIVNTEHDILGIAGINEEILTEIDKMMSKYDVSEEELKDQLFVDDYDFCCFGCYTEAIKNIVVSRVKDRFEDYICENNLDEDILMDHDVLDNFHTLDAIIDLEKIDDEDMGKLYNIIKNNRNKKIKGE